MSESLTLDVGADPAAAVAAAVRALSNGGVVVLPTETVYGVAALPSCRNAIEEVFRRKGRPPERLVAVLVADDNQARALVEADDRFEHLATAFWPGPLTVVGHRRSGGDDDLFLGDGATERGGATVGVRWPDHDLVRSIAAEVGPIATTSANRTGQPTPDTAAGAAAALGGDLLVLDGGPCTGEPSTVVDLTDHPARVVRRGAITESDLEQAGISVEAAEQR
ncbi:MAG: threonylcarbamoyl-AMP synthase [Acidimicrobiaceae bacterium]|nr:threonylcarbamoyl-AMP synthase [Acidimicrobiaceae bacterium]